MKPTSFGFITRHWTRALRLNLFFPPEASCNGLGSPLFTPRDPPLPRVNHAFPDSVAWLRLSSSCSPPFGSLATNRILQAGLQPALRSKGPLQVAQVLAREVPQQLLPAPLAPRDRDRPAAHLSGGKRGIDRRRLQLGDSTGTKPSQKEKSWSPEMASGFLVASFWLRFKLSWSLL